MRESLMFPHFIADVLLTLLAHCSCIPATFVVAPLKKDNFKVEPMFGTVEPFSSFDVTITAYLKDTAKIREKVTIKVIVPHSSPSYSWMFPFLHIAFCFYCFFIVFCIFFCFFRFGLGF